MFVSNYAKYSKWRKSTTLNWNEVSFNSSLWIQSNISSSKKHISWKSNVFAFQQYLVLRNQTSINSSTCIFVQHGRKWYPLTADFGSVIIDLFARQDVFIFVRKLCYLLSQYTQSVLDYSLFKKLTSVIFTIVSFKIMQYVWFYMHIVHIKRERKPVSLKNGRS